MFCAPVAAAGVVVGVGRALAVGAGPVIVATAAALLSPRVRGLRTQDGSGVARSAQGGASDVHAGS
ncbi:hypothetical protein [Streptomyces pinistramenti]|uniref:hypothetical protein n=1 Tax=Streptomyces pinistramenti TaxID=2884812 RepID=UPI001D0636E1|nr:hypothetical protein [Streptomyces pinistramenti]MCB5908956.1 hypothetical protein [Streptomyces pinistramenti]